MPVKVGVLRRGLCKNRGYWKGRARQKKMRKVREGGEKGERSKGQWCLGWWG